MNERPVLNDESAPKLSVRLSVSAHPVASVGIARNVGHDGHGRDRCRRNRVVKGTRSVDQSTRDLATVGQLAPCCCVESRCDPGTDHLNFLEDRHLGQPDVQRKGQVERVLDVVTLDGKVGVDVEQAKLEEQYGHFVLLDIHSYNHRRDEPNAPPADPDAMAEINIGTASMDHGKWAYVVDPLITKLREFEFRGRQLHVQENVSFQGKGVQTRFVHESIPDSGCAIAIEFKKFLMNEWTGKPDRATLIAMRNLIRSTLPLFENLLMEMS